MQSHVEDETRRLVLLVEEATGLRLRWSGQVVVLEDAAMQSLLGRRLLGEKRWGCEILLHADLRNNPLRWRTLLHEVLHSVSAGTTEQDYRRFRGWEEGTVEWLQRRWRPEMLRSLEVSIPKDLFAAAEHYWPLNGYLEALQALQEACGVEEDQFYLNLLQTPLALRPAAVRAMRSEPDFLPLFARTIGRLR